MELTQSMFFQRTKIKVKLGTLNFNNMKNVEERYDVSEDVHVMDDFAVGNEIQKVKDYLLSLTVEDMRLFVAVEQGSRKMSESVLVSVGPKAKAVARSWTSILHRKEATIKDKIKI